MDLGAAPEKQVAPSRDAARGSQAAPASKRKRSFKEARELEGLPARIEALETRIAAMTAAMEDPGWHQRDGGAIAADVAALASAQAELDAAYLRWSELDD